MKISGFVGLLCAFILSTGDIVSGQDLNFMEGHAIKKNGTGAKNLKFKNSDAQNTEEFIDICRSMCEEGDANGKNGKCGGFVVNYTDRTKSTPKHCVFKKVGSQPYPNPAKDTYLIVNDEAEDHDAMLVEEHLEYDHSFNFEYMEDEISLSRAVIEYGEFCGNSGYKLPGHGPICNEASRIVKSDYAEDIIAYAVNNYGEFCGNSGYQLPGHGPVCAAVQPIVKSDDGNYDQDGHREALELMRAEEEQRMEEERRQAEEEYDHSYNFEYMEDEISLSRAVIEYGEFCGNSGYKLPGHGPICEEASRIVKSDYAEDIIAYAVNNYGEFCGNSGYQLPGHGPVCAAVQPIVKSDDGNYDQDGHREALELMRAEEEERMEEERMEEERRQAEEEERMEAERQWQAEEEERMEEERRQAEEEERRRAEEEERMEEERRQAEEEERRRAEEEERMQEERRQAEEEERRRAEEEERMQEERRQAEEEERRRFEEEERMRAEEEERMQAEEEERRQAEEEERRRAEEEEARRQAEEQSEMELCISDNSYKKFMTVSNGVVKPPMGGVSNCGDVERWQLHIDKLYNIHHQKYLSCDSNSYNVILIDDPDDTTLLQVTPAPESYGDQAIYIRCRSSNNLMTGQFSAGLRHDNPRVTGWKVFTTYSPEGAALAVTAWEEAETERLRLQAEARAEDRAEEIERARLQAIAQERNDAQRAAYLEQFSVWLSAETEAPSFTIPDNAVCFKGPNGSYLSLEGDLTTVNTNRNSCGKWSIFVEKDGGLYSPGHQTYLTCSNDSFVATFASNNRIDGQITGSATQVGDDQRISTAAAPSTYGNGKIGLRCDNTGQFFRAQGSRLPVYSMRNEIGGWEVFEKEDYQP